jgi:hypothetical protein
LEIKNETLGGYSSIHIIRREVAGFLEITFTDQTIPVDENDLESSRVYLTLDKIGISLITSSKNQRIELSYIELVGLEMCKMIYDLTNAVSHHIRLRYINIDNNHKELTYYPVMLTTKKNLSVLLKENKYFLDFFIMKSETPRLKLINRLSLTMEKCVLRIEEEFINHILAVKKSTRA